MLKFSAPIIALALAVAPTAVADTTEVAVELEYDSAMLVTEAGAEEVISSLKSQAKDACAYRSSITFTSKIDRSCVKSVVAEAATEILAEREEAGLETADVFTRLAAVEYASLD